MQEKVTAAEAQVSSSSQEAAEEVRSYICHQVMQAVTPLIEPWGIKVIAFQISSILFADESFAKQYESYSLNIAKTNAQKRTVTAQREITNIQATAAAQAAKIQSEAEGQAAVLKAKGEADARLIIARAEADSEVISAEADAKSRRLDASSRNDAATIMQNEFARTYAMAAQQVQFAANLKCQSLTVLPDSVIGKPVCAIFFAFPNRFSSSLSAQVVNNLLK